MKLLYSALYNDDCHPFNILCANTDVVKDPEELVEKDSALIIWGGQDINPEYYRHPMHPTTHPGGMRDRLEWSLMQRAIEMGITIIGVCRGAQMACAAAGGWLIQNVHHHHGGHMVETSDGKKFRVNSIHHQMMVPNDVEHELLVWSATNLSNIYGYMDNQEWTPPAGWREPEFVYFPKINGYAIQWHPEGMAGDSEATQYVLNYIKQKEGERDERSRNFLACQC